MPTTEEVGQGIDEVESLEREGISLRWAGHRLHGANVGLRQRHESAMGNLEGRSDGEANAVLLRLAKESKEMNGELAEHLSRTAMLNLGVVEMLRKSRDGRAALMMRSAAEILVKGLANAEEEVHALKASLKEVEGQRDSFKTLLAKTNSELNASQAYDQIGNAVGQDSASSAAAATAAATAAAEGVVALQLPPKRNPPVRQEQHPSNDVGGSGGGAGGGGGSSSNSGGVSVATADGRISQSSFNSGVDRGLGKGDPRAETRKRQRGVGRGAGKTAAAAAAAASAVGKRRRGIVVGVGDGAIPSEDWRLQETNRQKQQRKGNGRGEGLGRTGDGVDLTLSQEGPGRWAEPWKDGGGGVAAGGDAGDLQGVYDSDDAPSMFF